MDSIARPGQEGSESQLTQQGSIDWIQLARTTITFPISVLARLAAADIAPHTVVVGQRMSSIFVLSMDGIERVMEALKSLSSCSSIGDVIWFGFGIRHIVREIAQTAQGAVFLTLCGSLAELHPPKACAAILMKLAEVCGMPGELRPSPQQWINMVEACSGILRPTTFGCVAGQFMAFSGSGACGGRTDNAEDVARALYTIALLSSEALKSVTLVGGQSCGWIAAFGYFFLGIHVEIRTAGGTLYYRSAADEDEVRIFVVYDETAPSNTVQVNNKAYRIRTIDEFILGWENRFDSTMSGSVPWETCVTEIFGAPAIQLLEAKEQFGELISCAARVFQGLTKAEPSLYFDRADFQTWFGFQAGQSGHGFVDSAVFWFPELASLRGYIQLDPDESVDDAVEAYTEAAEQITALCGCHHCQGSYAAYRGRSYCLTVLAETLIFLVWNLSAVELGANLKPYRSGLRFIYELHAGEAETDKEFGERYGGSRCRDAYWGDIVRLVRLLDLASVYHTAQFLFTTNLYPQVALSTFTAASVGGICFYFNFLREISDAPDRSVILHVLPGGIATREGRTYQYVADKMGFSPNGLLGLDWREKGTFDSVPEFALNYTCDPPQIFAAPDFELANDTGSHDLKASLVVEESPQALLVDLCVSGSRGSCRVGVYQILREVIESSGLVHCSHRNCVAVQQPSADTLIVDGEGCMPQSRQKAVYVRRLAGNSLARCVGLLVGKDSFCDDIILRRRECIPCCMKAAVSNDERRPVYVIL